MRNQSPGMPPEGAADPVTTEHFQTLHEIAQTARQRLPRNIWDYLIGGTETETALRRNRMAIDTLALRPRVLRDVSFVDTSTNFLGAGLKLPLMCAPIGSLESFEPGGGATAAKATARVGALTCLSSVSGPGLEATAAAADGHKIYQLYVRGDGDWIDEQVQRAIDNGYLAFCLTVDTAIYSRRERDIANRFIKPWRSSAIGFEFQSSLNWDDVRRFKDRHDLPLLLKGIMTGEDAAMAAELGVDAVWVSNHGGRQVDHAQGTMTVLPEIVGAVGGRSRIVIDGGFLRGTDIVKALAAGADIVALGRFTGLALAAAGEEGLVRALDLLAEEMWTAMGLVGATKLSEIVPEHIEAAPATAEPRVFSAFPLIDDY